MHNTKSLLKIVIKCCFHVDDIFYYESLLQVYCP